MPTIFSNSSLTKFWISVTLGMLYFPYMKDITDNIIPVLKKYGVKKAALFGSYARGDFDDQSDIELKYI